MGFQFIFDRGPMGGERRSQQLRCGFLILSFAVSGWSCGHLGVRGAAPCYPPYVAVEKFYVFQGMEEQNMGPLILGCEGTAELVLDEIANR